MAENNFANSILESAGDLQKSLVGSQQVNGFSMEEIGKPYRFAESVDPQDRTYRFLATRMNAVDIYPCTYAMSYLYTGSKTAESKGKTGASTPSSGSIGATIASGASNVGGGNQQAAQQAAAKQGGGSAADGKSVFKYGIGYDIAMKRYRQMCQNYLGDLNPPSALRIFLTDDTTTTDGIQTQYAENFFQKLADGLSNAMQGFTSIASSLSSASMNEAVDKLLSEDNINTDKIVGDVSKGLNLSDGARGTMGEIVKGLKQGAKIVLKGQKLALPKIWQSSSYSSAFSVSTKLFSPYGSPKAIKKYIIRPLTLILLMGMPQTDDMVSYGKPFAVTVRSWGTSFLTLAGITNITLQRGGADSVFNIYKQPLVVNVNIEFSSLVDGVMAFGDTSGDAEVPQYESSAYGAIDQILPVNSASQNIDGSVLPTVIPTLGGIIRSFQPVQMSGISFGYGPQQSTRDDVMVGGNGSGGGGLGGGLFGALMSPFDEVYGQATSGAFSQGGFGGFLGGIAETAVSITQGVGSAVRTINQTVSTATNLANLVSFGAFGKTGLAKQIGKFQNNMSEYSRAASSIAGSAVVVSNTVNRATEAFGSLFKTPVKK